MLKTRRLNGDILRNSTAILNLLSNKEQVIRCHQRITQSHSYIWKITGQILYSIYNVRKTRDHVTIVPGKTVHIMDSLANHVPPWTEIMERIGSEIPRHPKCVKTTKKIDITNLRGMLKYDSSGRCINAFQLIARTDFLKLAYEIIKSKPGNMVHGSDKLTLDGLPVSWFEETSSALLSEAYQFKPARIVLIPKANGKKRPLGISSPRDKIIQQSAKMVLETILEPKFSSTSHGFRPTRGCHSALAQVRKWKGVSWILEGDIKSFFDNIDHDIIAKLLERHFCEKRLLNLYWKLVQAGYIEWDNHRKKFIYPKTGVPQGGIVSPLLSNLILHEFDVYMEKLILKRENMNKGVKETLYNPAYARLTRKVSQLRNERGNPGNTRIKELRR